MKGLEQRLARRWRDRIEAASVTPRRGPGFLREWRHQFGGAGVFRLLGWGLALTPAPASWQLFAVIVTARALADAWQLLQRGQTEWLLSLYGGTDDDLLEPTRRMQVQRACWAAIDAAVVLGIWWFQARVPGWTLLLGVPAFTLGVMIGPRLLAAVIPPALWRLLVPLGPFTLILLGVLLANSVLPPSLAEGVFVVAGWTSPAGWVVVMLRGLLEGRTALVGLPILLGVGAILARGFARRQDGSLVDEVTGGNEEPALRDSHKMPLPEVSPPSPAVADAAGRASVRMNEAEAGEVWLEFRERDLLDLPRGGLQSEPLMKKVVWTIVVLLGLAVLNRPEFEALGVYRHLILGIVVGVAFASWIPLLGTPAWLWHCIISSGRACSAFALFPVSLRNVMKRQAVRDLRQSGIAFPGLALLLFFVLEIAFTPPWLDAAVCAVTASVTVFTFLPLRWFRLTLWAQSNKPFRLPRIILGAAIVVMAIVFLLQIVLLIVLFYMLFGGVLEPKSLALPMAIPVLVLGLVNALAGLAGAAVSVRAFERGRYDLIKVPQDVVRG